MTDHDEDLDRQYDIWRMTQEEMAAHEGRTAEDQELAQNLAYIYPEAGMERSGPFVVNNDEKAQWALRKLALAQAEKGRIEQAAKREMERVAEWRDRAVKRSAGTIEAMEALLVGYRRQLDQEDPKRAATYKLPSGDLKRVPGGVRVEVLDEHAFTQWALANNRAAVKVTPLVGSLKGPKSAYQPVLPKDVMAKVAQTHQEPARSVLVNDDGEQVPGAELVVDPPSFKVVAR